MKEINGYLLCEVPSDAKDFVIDMGYLIFKVMDMHPSKWTTDAEIKKDAIRFLKTGKSKFSKLPEDYSMWITSGMPLPQGNYSIIGLAKDLTEEQWKGIVEHRYEYGNGKSKGVLITKDYVGGKALETFTESGHSLLKANNLNPNNCLILKKI